MNWPVFDHPEVFHIGTLDPSKKGTTHNSHSYEGNGLSVSLEPQAWMAIAKLGGYPTWHLSFVEEASLGNGAAKFVDLDSLTDSHWQETMSWAVKEELVEPSKLIVVNWYDSELDETVCMKFDGSTEVGKEKAFAEFDGKDGSSMTMEDGWKQTQKLIDRIGFKVDPASVKEMALTLYVEDVLFPKENIIGVWWDGEVDVSSYAAPCGVINPKAVDLWKKEEADPSRLLRMDTVAGFQRALSEFKDDLYSVMVNEADCGPFDGCCLVFAEALKSVIGGEIVVVTNEDGRADHAGVYLDGKIYDFDGPLRPDDFMERFSRNEHVEIQGWRKIQSEDLKEAVRDSNVRQSLEALLNEALSEHLELKQTLGNARQALAFVEEVDNGSKSKPSLR